MGYSSFLFPDSFGGKEDRDDLVTRGPAQDISESR